MSHPRQSWKRFIDTVIRISTEIITKSPFLLNNSPKDQEMLQDFLDTLYYYNVDTQTNRKKFFDSVNQLRIKYSSSDIYLRTPFLWFALTYFDNASQILINAKFHADNFYEYLVESLRGKEDIKGFFRLIKESTPLKDYQWQKLQYFSNKISEPLTKGQLKSLSEIYSLIRNKDFLILKKEHLIYIIEEKLRNFYVSLGIDHFLQRIDARWNLWYNLKSFGLDQIFINFEINEKKSLDDFIDFNHPNNKTLTSSNIYHIYDSPNKFLGLIVIPSRFRKYLYDYFRQSEASNNIHILDTSIVEWSSSCASLNLYIPEKGWRELSPLEYQEFQNDIKEAKTKNEDLYFVTPKLNNEWHYHEYPAPLEAIALFLKTQRSYTINSLPFSYFPKDSILTKGELDLLSELHKKQVVTVTFRPSRILMEYALNLYWIVPPPVYTWEELTTLLLKWLPSAYIFATEDNNFHIISALTPKMFIWINEELNWLIYRITPKFSAQTLNLEWYDFEKLQWKNIEIFAK